MIGSGLKKFAVENGLTVKSGVAYGNFRGYTVSMFEGSGWKTIVINTRFSQMEDMTQLTSLLHGKDTVKTYRLSQTQVTSSHIQIVFADTVGTMKRVRAFADWFFPVLDGYDVTKFGICDECGQPIEDDGVWKIVGSSVVYVHTHCGDTMEANIRFAEEEARENDTGSYLTGFVGALVGSLIGAVLWAVVMNLGFIAGIVGLLIAFLAVKGYDLLHGKQGKAKVVIVAVCVVAAVLIGNYFAYLWMLRSALVEYDIAFTTGELPKMLNRTLAEEAAVRGEFLRNVIMGLLLGVFGSIGIITRTAKSVSGTKVKDLH